MYGLSSISSTPCRSRKRESLWSPLTVWSSYRYKRFWSSLPNLPRVSQKQTNKWTATTTTKTHSQQPSPSTDFSNLSSSRELQMQNSRYSRKIHRNSNDYRKRSQGKKNQQPPLPVTLHSSSSLISLKKSKQGWQSLMVHRNHSGKELHRTVMKPADLGDDAAFYPQRSM